MRKELQSKHSIRKLYKTEKTLISLIFRPTIGPCGPFKAGYNLGPLY